jgi:4-hydroxy-tetrahydrodipicolinate synthase
LTVSRCGLIIYKWLSIPAQCDSRKKLPCGGVRIDARDKPFRHSRSETPPRAGFFIVPSPALNVKKEMGPMNDPRYQWRHQLRHQLQDRLQGLWLPLVTPFRDGGLDEPSLRRLVRHYASRPIDGLILAATSGEGLTLSVTELGRITRLVRAELIESRRDLPVCLGLAGAATAKMLDTLDETAAWPIDGYLISSPYYVRPSQRGLHQHFAALADHAALPIVLYNIPYRTSVNLANETLLALAEHPNIAGLKDCCADRAQSIDLLRRRPPGFRILTGEDAQYHDALIDGADGAILLSAHIETDQFAAVRTALEAGDHVAALVCWRRVSELTRLLFAEPSPAPAKYWLARTGLIASAEVRSPMVEVSAELSGLLDQDIARRMQSSKDIGLVNAR